MSFLRCISQLFDIINDKTYEYEYESRYEKREAQTLQHRTVWEHALEELE